MPNPCRLLPLLVAVTVLGCAGLRGRADFQPFRAIEKPGGRWIVDPRDRPSVPLVQLCARHSYLAPKVAIHPWFLAYDPETDLWEEWQIWGFGEPSYYESEEKTPYSVTLKKETRRVVLRRASYGYIDFDQSTLGGDQKTIIAEWREDEARRILKVLRAPHDYPYRDVYRAWPGPNSNTYASWVLRRARVRVDLHPLAIGKDYRGPLGFGGGVSDTRTGLQLETPMLGAKFGVLDGVEAHFLCLTFGVDLWPPALKTPLGRFGLPE